MKKLLCSFALLGLAIASAKSYTVNLYQTARVGNTELKAGAYRLEVIDQKAVISNGSAHGEAAVTVNNNEKKHSNTSVRLLVGEGTPRIDEIRIGGTKTTLKFVN
jgi:hypothetical protein